MMWMRNSVLNGSAGRCKRSHRTANTCNTDDNNHSCHNFNCASESKWIFLNKIKWKKLYLFSQMALVSESSWPPFVCRISCLFFQDLSGVACYVDHERACTTQHNDEIWHNLCACANVSIYNILWDQWRVALHDDHDHDDDNVVNCTVNPLWLRSHRWQLDVMSN